MMVGGVNEEPIWQNSSLARNSTNLMHYYSFEGFVFLSLSLYDQRTTSRVSRNFFTNFNGLYIPIFNTHTLMHLVSITSPKKPHNMGPKCILSIKSMFIEKNLLSWAKAIQGKSKCTSNAIY
jgi:hypothetical protein